MLLNQPRRFVLQDCYWGQAYDDSQVADFLRANAIPHQCFDDQDRMLDRVVDELVDGKVIGWFRGRFEWGPRALGNRSILADPRRPEMKTIVNAKIKFREPFRPFAPVVLEERAAEYFDLPQPERQFLARFMLLVAPIHTARQDAIPAVSHLGTGRLQTIRCDTNAAYYNLVRKFGQATGVPVLLNTSYNLRGEPIVSSPANAMATFNNSGLDTLVMDRFLIHKAGGTQ